ncbi:PIN domain-containing protein [Paraburkholderia terrae]|uniref:PIN domain-containing protein n=1 Tax=Paraburkholderia terrae TaxID=311230 RepID=UPI001EE1D0DF|nr:PIN domain-containing protein [Paraburkholderia terrae]GJH04495.1 hypothetical protein CBA19C8_28080 [Paraburkholderia terrae]
MKQTFCGQYRPEQKEIEQMWATGIFVFDANALLNLYRYTDATREEFMQTLEALRARVWIPYQVGFEFFQNRASVMSTAVSGYAKLRTELGKTRDDLGRILNGFRRHPGINVEAISRKLDDTFSELQASLEEQEALHPDWLTGEDPVLQRLSGVFDGKVGNRPEAAERQKLIDQAKARYERLQPPGLRDKEKGGDNQYGDAVLWLEILQMATGVNSPVIFVTDDVKDDWWQRVGGKTIGPLPELRQELWDVADVPMHMYQCDQFLRYASEFLDRRLPQASIEEAAEVRHELQRSMSVEDLNRYLSSVENGTVSENDELTDALRTALGEYPRPKLVSDYRGPTIFAQISNLIEERKRLRDMFLGLSTEERRSEAGRAIREALDFVEKEVITKKRWRDAASHLLSLSESDDPPNS